MKVKSAKLKVQSEEVELLKNQLARALADYDNLRKRTEGEKEIWEKIVASKAVSKLLPVLDILISAQGHLKDAGLDLAIKEFKNTLAEMGFEEIQVKAGDEFNPLLEEVVETVQGGTKHKVAEVVQSGWKIKDEAFVIRPTKVKVYGEKSKKEEELEKEMARGGYV